MAEASKHPGGTKSDDKAETPVPAEDNNRIMNEVLKNGRAVLTPSGTARFVDRREGLATRLYYHGLLPREDISKMLQDNGNFIVRTTSTVDVGFNPQKCLSVRWNEKVRHFLLDKGVDGVYSVDKHKTKFKSVEDLVDHYHKTGEAFSVHNCKLITPIGRAKWEFRHSQIELSEKLGEGMFGEVYSGYLSTKRNRILVAIKTLKCAHVTKEKIDESMKEARLLRRCHHRNIVRFYGVAAEEEPLMIIMEMVTGGSLDVYLEQKGPEILVDERMRMCCQAAFAIRYLHQRNILHRDIAARNCLYDREKCLKLSDFGLSVHAKKYRMQRSERIPLRWMSPEVFRTQLYTQHADIWAFGVLVWEIFNNGAEPYSEWNGAQIKRELLENNYRLTLPNSAPDPMKKLLKKIWTLDSEVRMTANEVASEISKMTPNFTCDPSDTTTTTDNYKFLKENGGQSFGGSMESVLRGKDGRPLVDPELHMSESIEESSYAPPSEYNNCLSGDKPAVKKKRGSLKKAAKHDPTSPKKRNSGNNNKKKNRRTMDTQEVSSRDTTKASKKTLDRSSEDKEKQKEKNSKRKEKKSCGQSREIVKAAESNRVRKDKTADKEKKKDESKDKDKTPSKKHKEPKKSKKAKYYEQPAPAPPPPPPPPPPALDVDKTIIQDVKTPPPRQPYVLSELEQTQELDLSERDREPTTTTTTLTDPSCPVSRSASPERKKGMPPM